MQYGWNSVCTWLKWCFQPTTLRLKPVQTAQCDWICCNRLQPVVTYIRKLWHQTQLHDNTTHWNPTTICQKFRKSMDSTILSTMQEGQLSQQSNLPTPPVWNCLLKSSPICWSTDTQLSLVHLEIIPIAFSLASNKQCTFTFTFLHTNWHTFTFLLIIWLWPTNQHTCQCTSFLSFLYNWCSGAFWWFRVGIRQ